jgi:hypothetical protein
VTETGQINDPGTRARGEDFVKEELGEEEVTEVIGGKLHLNAILVLCELLNSHDTRVIDQVVQLGDLAIDLGSGSSDGIEVVEGDGYEGDLDVGINLLDARNHRVNSRLGASKEDEVFGMATCERDGGLASEGLLACTSDDDFAELAGRHRPPSRH